ncbi:MAG: DUF192 domain-containing protein [Parcubacteria group bacterium]|nr:DUF192 domain-containing protein [Parcubacteria group bacterium]
MKKILLFFIPISLAAGLAGWLILKEKNSYKAELYTLWLGETELKVELAQSQGQRERGLSGRKSLPQNQGLLFVFEKPGLHSFWMREMRFDLDIIWLDKNYRVTDMAPDVKPESYPNYFVPEKEALYVLEVNAGWSKINNITLGSPAVFLQSYQEKEKSKENLIRLDEPKIGGIIKNPFIIKGQARGNWFFEASFPVKVMDANGKIIMASYAETQDNWMTTDFVPFEKEFYFDSEPQTPYGFLILEKDNPSGLAEHADQIKIPIRFR